MTMTNIERLERQIEQLIREHIGEVRRKAGAAIDRAFTSSIPRRAQAPRSKARAAGPRRGADELNELAERLYSVVCANPGTAMATLATHVGSTVGELSRPAKRLLDAGRICIVGERTATRYFPLGKRSTQ